MAMNGCSVLVVLGAIATEDAVPDDSSIIEDCSAAIAITIRSSLIDAVLNDETIEDCANRSCQTVAERTNGSAAVDDGFGHRASRLDRDIAGDDDRVGMGAQSTTFFREAVPSVEDLGADSDCFGVDGVDTFDAV